MVVSLALPAIAKEGNNEKVSNTSIGTVHINSSVSMELKNVGLISTTDGKLASFTLQVANKSSEEFQFIHYWVRMKSKSGTKFTVNLLPEDKDVNIIPANTTREIGFYAKVNDTVKLNDLVFNIIRWDFSKPNFEAQIGTINVPANYTQTTPVDAAKTVPYLNTELKTKINKVVLNKNEKSYFTKLYFNVENSGRASVNLPEWNYYIETSEGYLYPLEVVKGKDKPSIGPREIKELELTNTIPASVANKGWELVITRTIQGDKEGAIQLPVARYVLPKATEHEVSTGNEYSFTNEAGTYTAVLHSVQRLPWEDDDIVTSTLSLENRGDKSLPIPDLTAYYLLDENVRVEANIIIADKVVGIHKGSKLGLQVLGKIPYTYQFNTIDLIIEEKAADNHNEQLVQFRNNSTFMDIAKVKQDEQYHLDAIGRNSNYSVLSVNTYGGNTQDVVEVQLLMENAEKRQADMTNFVAHLTTANGSIYPAKIIRNEAKVVPGGKSLLSVWARIPSSVTADESFGLLLGEAIANNKLAGPDEEADAYVNAVQFELPEESKDVQDSLKEVALYPYTFSMGNIHTWLDQDGVRLAFDYELERDLSLLTSEEHKLLISVEEEGGKFEFSQLFSFESGLAKSEQGQEEQTLKLGKHTNQVIAKNDRELIFYLSTLKQYDLKIYSVFQGQTKLLASKKIQWFVTEE